MTAALSEANNDGWMMNLTRVLRVIFDNNAGHLDARDEVVNDSIRS